MTTKEQRRKSKYRAARRPELGSWHTITERASKFKHGERIQWHAEDIEDHSYCRGHWDKPYVKWHPAPPITSYRAMYIGYRYKQNEEWDTEIHEEYEDGKFVGSWEDTPRFIQTETVEVWLFVTHDNRKPLEVFPFEYPELEGD